MTLRLTNSEMSTFRRCERKWWVTTYRRLKPRAPLTPGSSLSIGNLVHDALAAYYDPEQRADPVAFVDERLSEALLEHPTYEDDLRAEHELVSIMLAGYLEWLEEEGADQDLVIEGTERFVEVPLVEGVTLLSKLDAPVTRVSDGMKLALEHKTVGSFDTAGLKLDTQFLTEHLARFLDDVQGGVTYEEAYDRCHGILHNGLRKVKRTARANPPFYMRTDVPHNIHELRNHWRHVLAVARQIQDRRARLDAGENPHAVCPPNPTRDCSWDCPLFKICVLADDGSDFEGALDALFVEGDPLERYREALPLGSAS